MILFDARKISTRRSALILCAALIHCATAFAADAGEDAQAQAQALLSGAPGIHTNGASVALPGADASAAVTDPQDRARQLLVRPARSPDAELRTDGTASGASVTAATPTGNQGTAYSGAQESARKMILGKGA
ncbi:MAG TPA: hypothetical protein VLB69_05125 [Rudaea sp.]|nr:hypothetical protein [Rudaea sp.]